MISKFGPKMHLSTFKFPIILGLIDIDLQFHNFKTYTKPSFLYIFSETITDFI